MTDPVRGEALSEARAEKQLDRHLAAWHEVNRASWATFGIFAAGNTVLASRGFDFALALFGVFLAAVGWLIQYRAVEFLNWHQCVVSRLEDRLGVPEDARALEANDVDGRQFFGRGLTVRHVWALLFPGVVEFWLIAAWHLAPPSLEVTVRLLVLLGSAIVLWIVMSSARAWLPSTRPAAPR